MISSGDNPSARQRVIYAAWAGWAGGTLFGLVEAWPILARNAWVPARDLIGVLAAVGFIVALDGAIGATSFSIIGFIAAQIDGLRRRFHDAPTWISLCIASFAALLTLLIGLQQFGVLSGIVKGGRAAIWAGASLVASVVVCPVTFRLVRSIIASQGDGVVRIIPRALAVVWVIAALMPLVFALIRSGLA